MSCLMWTKQNISADSVLPTGNQHVTFISVPLNIYKNYEKGLFPPQNELHYKSTGGATESWGIVLL